MLGNLFTIGKSALDASQAWISVTGSNIANADTEGYTRRYVDQRDAGGITTRCGEEGLGVNAQQVLRYFDQFLEKSYVAQSTISSRWGEHDTIMQSLESIFNEANSTGLNDTLNRFFTGWQDLALRPENIASRTSLLSDAETLAQMVKSTMQSIRAIQTEMDVSIKSGVDRINEIAQAIGDINREITVTTIDQVSNPNDLLDKRDQLVRELASLVDVTTVDRGKGDFRVQLSTGQPLVEGTEVYSMAFMDARAENHLRPESAYAGNVQFDGTDEYEYTVEIVTGGNASTAANPPSTPQFRVSLDGGKTWLRDEDGQEIHYDITDSDGDGKTDQVLVKDLRISFDVSAGFEAGDQFDIVPKKGLYWIEPTRGPQNVTPQIDLTGMDNPDRVTGGKLAAWFGVRDDNCGRYIDEMDAVVSTLIWEVNHLHSQGAGLEKLTYATGQQSVENTRQPLGAPQAVTPFYNKLTEGNANFHFYDKTTGSYLGTSMLAFSSASGNFDPATHTLEDVRDAFNNMTLTGVTGNPIQASIQDGKLLLAVNPSSDIAFTFGTDTTGLMAALGLNTFFSGSSAETLALNSDVRNNCELISAGHVDGGNEINEGDNAIANAIGALSEKNVTITTFWKTVKDQSLSEYYANLVTTVGSDKRHSATNAEYHKALSDDLNERLQSVEGVNLDEELSNLIKYQHSYTAAAKLITTADQMLQTLLGLKQ